MAAFLLLDRFEDRTVRFNENILRAQINEKKGRKNLSQGNRAARMGIPVLELFYQNPVIAFFQIHVGIPPLSPPPTSNPSLHLSF